MKSLVLRIYVCAAGTLVVSFLVVATIGRLFFAQGEGQLFRRFGLDVATFVVSEVQAATGPSGPDRARLATIERGLHVELTVVPWSDPRRPGALSTRPLVTPWELSGHDHDFWARLQEGSRPAALRMRFRLPHPKPGLHLLIVPLFFVGLLTVMLVPPLALWVVRPLRGMGAIAHRLGAGDLATPVPVRRQDEFGDLERAFEALRVRIQAMLHQKERLLLDVSHELRGPLSRMAIALPLLRGAPPGEDVSPYLDQLEREAATMEALIGELLALARDPRPEGAALADVDLALVAREVVDTRKLALERAGLAATLHLDPAPVSGDARLLARALGNLVDNAIRYAAEGHELVVETAIQGDLAVARVADRGAGVEEADLPHLFEPFYRPDASRSRASGGTGLGLAIVRSVAEGHGGEARVANRPGGGLVAELVLPRAPRSPTGP